jgi:hypothetical protein
MTLDSTRGSERAARFSSSLSWSARLALKVVAALLTLAACATGQGEGVSVDTRPVKGIQLFEGWIGEHGPYEMFVDTGVDPSVIDEALARQIGLPIDDRSVGEAEGAGDGAGLEVRSTSISELSIGGRSFGSVEALAADLSSFAAVMGVDLKAILGYSFLKRRVVRFDLQRERLDVAESIGSLPPMDLPLAQRVSFPLRFNSQNDPIPVFQMSLAGDGFLVSLDTGKSKGVEFFAAAEQRLGIRDRMVGLERSDRLGARGKRTVDSGSLAGLAIGPIQLGSLPVSLGRVPDEAGSREGNAGNAAFQGLVVTVDYVGGEIIFER